MQAERAEAAAQQQVVRQHRTRAKTQVSEFRWVAHACQGTHKHKSHALELPPLHWERKVPLHAFRCSLMQKCKIQSPPQPC